MATASLSPVDCHKSVLWSSCGPLPFEIVRERGGASNVNLVGNDNAAVQGVTLDSLLDGGEATFIKMDIEGSEMEALKGAADTIRNHHPFLAICVYHRPDHILDIPLFIRGLHPGYRFRLRHYGSPNPMAETVVYAIPEERP